MKITLTRLPDLRAQKLVEINAGFEDATNDLTADYPPTEKLTWPTQHAEAIAWGVNPASPTPYLDGLAISRGISPEELREKTLHKVQLFLAASQFLVGTRQWLEDRIKVATTAQQIAEIRWPTPQELALMREALTQQ